MRLEPQVALHVALMLHELGTNSVKYGALSKPEGTVGVGWSVDGGKLKLEWRERGGPPVKSPIKRGFGTTLIEQTAKSEGGSSQMVVEAGGLRWEIVLQLKTEKPTASQERRPTTLHSPAPRGLRPAPPAEPLKGKRFLIVEDEPLIALDIVAGLEGVGIDIEGPVAP